jgi:Raf kinase inhibitor-like YbhB/YbcL family protein
MSSSPRPLSPAAVLARTLLPLLALAAALLALGCGSSDRFSLSSPDVASGTIQEEQVFGGFGCTGGNVSPALAWKNAPSGTRSFAVTMFDQDAPTGSGFWHWTVFDLPATATELAHGASSGTVPAGAIQGYTDFGASGYGGPCPPAGDPAHRYLFTVYALKVETLGLDAGAPGALVSFSATANALASASFTARYGRPGTPTAHPEPPTVPGFTLTSAEITPGQAVPAEQVFDGFGCTGANVSPSLSWTGAPQGTQGFVLTMFDLDAPTGSGFWHWLVFDIPASATSIPKGAGVAGGSPAGGTQGYTDFGASTYGGPCPPAGDRAHRYVFTLYAVSAPDLATQGLSETSTGGLVGFVTRSVAIAKAELTATYGR